jgi:adenine phosphoribosyltransferase
MVLEELKKSLLKSPVVKKKDYYYVVHPITDGVPEISPKLLNEVVNEMYERISKYGKIEKIVTMEAMGIPLATSLSNKMNIPFVIIRKRSYGLPGEYVVKQKTGYSKSNLYINGLKKGDNIIIVDDVLSTGGTLKVVLTALRKIGVNINGIFIAVDKGNVAENIMQEYNIKIDVLATINVTDGKVLIKNI